MGRHGIVPSSVQRLEMGGRTPKHTREHPIHLRELTPSTALQVHMGTNLSLLLIEDNSGDADLIRELVRLKLPTH